MFSIGFIGAGKMAHALINGILNANLTTADQLAVFDTDSQKTAELANQGICVCADNRDLAERCSVIILAVKPNACDGVLSELAGARMDGKILISIAAGISCAQLQGRLNNAVCVRVMPNTPAQIGQGMTAICGDGLDNGTLKRVGEIFGAVGRTLVLPERLMSGVTAVSGSSPAYVYIMLEAMADAAVKQGIDRADAYVLAAQSVKGAAEMLLKTDLHPGQLKDMVCSPGGTTIEAVGELERAGFRSAIIRAIDACAKKAENMN